LRIAEAAILFPKYAAKFITKRARTNSYKNGTAKAPLYLPDSEYRGEERPDLLCVPEMSPSQKAESFQFFKDGCQSSGKRKKQQRPIITAPLDEEKWESDLSNRIRPEFITPPSLGSLDLQPIFGRKKTRDPADQYIMDSFIMELKKAMGDDYFDINEVRYFPRSDGRVYAFKSTGSKKEKQMKYGHLDVTVFLRNREIRRQLQFIKDCHLLKGLPWSDAIEETYEREIIEYVNPETVSLGRTYHSLHLDLGIETDQYSAPDPLKFEATAPPEGMSEGELGTGYFWSDRAGRMVSIQEERERLAPLDGHGSETTPGKRKKKAKPFFE
jgi:hypothetical protein